MHRVVGALQGLRRTARLDCTRHDPDLARIGRRLGLSRISLNRANAETLTSLARPTYEGMVAEGPTLRAWFNIWASVAPIALQSLPD